MNQRLDVTDTELSILEVLWREGRPLPIAVVVERLYGERSVSAHATVQSLLGRLEAKGCVERQRAGRAHLYVARVARGDVIGHQLRTLADRLCDGSLTPLLTHLVKATRLSARERDELHQLLQSLEAPPENPKRRP